MISYKDKTFSYFLISLGASNIAIIVVMTTITIRSITPTMIPTSEFPAGGDVDIVDVEAILRTLFALKMK